jgi:hypothetical protein
MDWTCGKNGKLGKYLRVNHREVEKGEDVVWDGW